MNQLVTATMDLACRLYRSIGRKVSISFGFQSLVRSNLKTNLTLIQKTVEVPERR